MKLSGVYLHSPFSTSNITEGNNRSLLLQFILSEIFHAANAHKNKEPFEKIYRPISSTFYPLDWSSQMGHLNKICEHTHLLKVAFPKNKDSASIFKHALTNTTALIANHYDNPSLSRHFEQELLTYFKQLYLLLEPLLLECSDDENIIFFLLKHQKVISHLSHSKYLLTFLTKMSEEGIDSLCEQICDSFHERGFASLIPEAKSLISELKKSHEQ